MRLYKPLARNTVTDVHLYKEWQAIIYKKIQYFFSCEHEAHYLKKHKQKMSCLHLDLNVTSQK